MSPSVILTLLRKSSYKDFDLAVDWALRRDHVPQELMVALAQLMLKSFYHRPDITKCMYNLKRMTNILIARGYLDKRDIDA